MNDVGWSKAPEGAQYYSASDDGFYTFYRNIKESTYEIFYCGGTRWVLHVGTPKEHYTIIPRLAPAWNGEGLPPVGAVCEFKVPSSGGWLKARIIFVSAWTVVLYVFFEHEEHCYSVSAFEKGNLQFRPIRTPEQIAADERDKAIKAIVGLIESADSRDMTIAEAIYNSGYRKPC